MTYARSCARPSAAPRPAGRRQGEVELPRHSRPRARPAAASGETPRAVSCVPSSIAHPSRRADPFPRQERAPPSHPPTPRRSRARPPHVQTDHFRLAARPRRPDDAPPLRCAQSTLRKSASRRPTRTANRLPGHLRRRSRATRAPYVRGRSESVPCPPAIRRAALLASSSRRYARRSAWRRCPASPDVSTELNISSGLVRRRCARWRTPYAGEVRLVVRRGCPQLPVELASPPAAQVTQTRPATLSSIRSDSLAAGGEGEQRADKRVHTVGAVGARRPDPPARTAASGSRTLRHRPRAPRLR